MTMVIRLLSVGLMAESALIASDDVMTLHRLAERVSKAERVYQDAVKQFNVKARAWEADCKAEGKTPQIDGFSNPKCVFVPVPVSPPGTTSPTKE